MKARDRLIEDAATRHRWTREFPAPDLVGLLYVELLRADGERVGEKRLASTLGWSQHRVRKLLAHFPRKKTQQPKPKKTVASVPKPSKPRKKSNTKPPAWVDAWAEVNSLRAEHIDGCRPLSVTKERRYALARIHREHGSDGLLKVVRWYFTSHHDRAIFLRDNGYGVDTLLRKFDQYIELVESNGTPRPVNTISYQDLVNHPESHLFIEADSLTELGRTTIRSQIWPAKSPSPKR